MAGAVILGAHTSIAGGLHHALQQGMEMGCDMVQIFSKNQRQWRSPSLTDESVRTWRDTWKDSTIGPVVCHDSYLINLGHPDDEPWERSIAAFTDELERCQRLGIPQLVFHPGSHLGRLSDEECCDRVAAALNRCFSALPRCRTLACIENTAGQGNNIGHRFEHLARIIRKVRKKRLLGTCFDTCHAFAAGYDLRGPRAYEETFAQFDDIVGLDRLKCFHLNDAKRERGSRVDRHENIGQGHLGPAFFRRLVNDPRFAEHPAAVETPVETHGGHVGDLKRLRKLLRKSPRRGS